MDEEKIYAKLLEKEIAVRFTTIDSFKIFCSFLLSKGIFCKNDSKYYWEKYGNTLCVTLTDELKFKVGSNNFYEKAGRGIYVYDKKPYVVNLLD